MVVASLSDDRLSVPSQFKHVHKIHGRTLVMWKVVATLREVVERD